MKTDNTFNYIFWHNSLETNPTWYAIPREEYLLFFNGKRKETKGVLSDKDINQLIKKIDK
jgi:hypothetical protein